MPIPYEQAMAQAQAYADDTVTGLDCLSISAPSLATPLHVVNDTQGFSHGGIEYLPYGFSIKAPDVEAQALAEATITIGYFSPEQLSALRTASKQHPAPEAVYRYFEVDASGFASLAAEWPVPMSVDSIVVGKTSFSITLRGDDFVNPPFIKQMITTERFPGLAT